MKIEKKEALDYHQGKRNGKIEVVTTKPVNTQRDLSLAYSPGVAEPCLEIAKDKSKVYDYTIKSNLVAVISNGTAVLGLGNIGPEASKPVMEGKGVLFKTFADIDVFDIELDSTNHDDLVKAIKMMEPTFGGINLEDFKGPECFYLEEALKKAMNIPVFHDDQHGTAIISGAAMLNAVEIAGKKLSDIRAVYSGSGAAGIACAKFHISLGLKPENVIMCDSQGVIYKGRTERMNEFKEEFAVETNKRTLHEALVGADMFFGLSSGDIIGEEDVRAMSEKPIILALANPNPEIDYNLATSVRKDLIMATGRSDYPNQVNNVLCFPFIFRGALDVNARQINEEMKIAAANAIAELTRQEVPESVKHAYGIDDLSFGSEYIIPKPFDPRVLTWVAPAVAKAAMDSGVARKEIEDWDKYRLELEIRMGRSHSIMTEMYQKATKNIRRVLYPEGEEPRIIRTAELAVVQKIAYPILLGREEVIRSIAEEYGNDLTGIVIINPKEFDDVDRFIDEYYRLRSRKGVTMKNARNRILNSNNHFGAMMIKFGLADSMISGLTTSYPKTIRPALEIVQKEDRFDVVSGLYIVITKTHIYFLADTTVNETPTPQQLSDITIQTSEFCKSFDIEPKVALLSYSNFGSATGESPSRMRKALEIIKERVPELIIDGEMQADTAIVPDIIENDYSFSTLKGGANVLVFPDLNSGNITYKMLDRLGNFHVMGPVLQGMNKSVHVLQKGATVSEIVDMTAIAVVMASVKK